LRLTLDILLEQVQTELHVDAASVLLFDPILGTLEYAAGRGFRIRGTETASMRLGDGLGGQAAIERKPLIIQSRLQEHPNSVRAPWLAQDQFEAYIAAPLIAKGLVRGLLEVFHRAPLDPKREWMEYFEALAGQAAIAIENALLFDGLQRSNRELILAYDSTIAGWSHALDLRDKETEGHTQRVTEMTVRLARRLGIGDEELVHIRRGALLHDIGKMGIPDRILLKPGPLTEDEWVIMRQHPTFAFDMLSPIAYLRLAIDIPYCHHEKWDGGDASGIPGYPRRLRGDAIPLAARLFAVVDAWDALSSDRPYREAWLPERVREYILEQAGKHFDPCVVEAFLADKAVG
jgi:putative nucleotidyltransferase with HDIG domain